VWIGVACNCKLGRYSQPRCWGSTTIERKFRCQLEGLASWDPCLELVLELLLVVVLVKALLAFRRTCGREIKDQRIHSMK
jgi:hypothetical protein